MMMPTPEKAVPSRRPGRPRRAPVGGVPISPDFPWAMVYGVMGSLLEPAAFRFEPQGCHRDDLVQAGTIGLFRAYQRARLRRRPPRVEPDALRPVTPYLYSMMRGAMRHYMRDCVPLIHMPAYQQERGTDGPICVLSDDLDGPDE
jgi:hypothetical protein